MVRTAWVACALAALSITIRADTGDNLDGALKIATLTPPRAASSRGHALLTYELRVTNRSDTAVSLRSITIEAPPLHAPVAMFAGQDLDGRMVDLATGASVTRVDPGQTILIYIEFNAAALPARLAHLVSYELGGVPARISATTSAPLGGPIVLAAPFKSGTWVAVHQPDWARGHRRVLVAPPGDRRIPGRFAVDFVGVDGDGHVTRGDADRPADAIGYGEPVLAGADAVVAAARDDMKEASSISRNPAHSVSEGAGNYVALNLGGGRYAFYEHLRPGSVRVTSGQRVRRGEQIGEVGFSGDSTGPHLHLHVADGPDPARADGLPFALAHFEELGRYSQIKDLGRARWPTARRHVRREWPGYNAVIRF